MSKNSKNVIFTRAEVIKEARCRLRVSNFNLTPKEKNYVATCIDVFGSDLFDACKKQKNPEKYYVESCVINQTQEKKVEQVAYMLLWESAMWLIKIKYEQLKEVLGE